MPAFKVDEVLLHHPRAAAAGADGLGVWLMGCLWSIDQATDGHLPFSVVPTLVTGASRAAKKALASGLWTECTEHDRCYVMRAWRHENNAEARRRRDAERQAKYRRTRAFADVRERDGDRCRYCGEPVEWEGSGPLSAVYDHVDPDGPSTIGNLVVACRADNSRKGARTPEQAGMPLLDVTRVTRDRRDIVPVTSRERAIRLDTPSSNEVPPLSPPQGGTAPRAARPARRPTTIPTGWAPNDGHRTYAAQHRIDVEVEAAKFRDHAQMNGRLGKDWDAGFRMWLTKAVEFQASRPAVRPEPTPKPLRRFTADD